MEEGPNKIPGLSQEDHAEFRDRFMRVHPDVIPIDAKEPHKKFVERLSRDFLIHGIVPYYEPAEIRTRSDVIIVCQVGTVEECGRVALHLAGRSARAGHRRDDVVQSSSRILHVARVLEHLRFLSSGRTLEVPARARAIPIRVPGAPVLDVCGPSHSEEGLPPPLGAASDLHFFLAGVAGGAHQPQASVE